MHKLSTLDAGFLLAETHHSPKHVGGVQIFKLPKGKRSAWLKRMLEALRKVPPGFPFDHKLRDNSILSPVLVRDETFDIDYHVRHTVLPDPGTRDQLVEMISRLHANLLDRERPLWEFHLIEGLQNRQFAFYTKIHHAIADGITFTRWFAESGSPSPADMDSRPIWQRDIHREIIAEKTSIAELLSEGIEILGTSFKTTAQLSALGVKLIRRRIFEGEREMALPLDAPRTRFNVPTGAARNFSVLHYPMGEIHEMASSQGVSINDLVMTLSDLAVNRYLVDKGESPGEPLVVYMPVSLRRGEDDDGNLISLLQVKLASVHSDPLETLAQVSESSRSTRQLYGGLSRQAISLYTLGVALLPLGEELLRLDQVLPPAINLVISNVPGPTRTMYFRGAELNEVYPVNLLPPAVALNITVCSYAGSLFFGLVSGRTAIPDLGALANHLDNAYRELRELTKPAGKLASEA
jgi:diacylglycerol O-acyltransferase